MQILFVLALIVLAFYGLSKLIDERQKQGKGQVLLILGTLLLAFLFLYGMAKGL